MEDDDETLCLPRGMLRNRFPLLGAFPRHARIAAQTAHAVLRSAADSACRNSQVGARRRHVRCDFDMMCSALAAEGPQLFLF